jgi:Na+/citrate or Na+/malate symporter
MDVASIASAFIAAQMSQVQTAMAAKMLNMNADSAGNVAKLLEAAQQNMKSLANVASGVGGNLDITV